MYDVPDLAPTDLPEGEDEGYPMLIYQFMHAQVRSVGLRECPNFVEHPDTWAGDGQPVRDMC